MRRVIIESPYAADKSLPPEERRRIVVENLAYLDRCLADCFRRSEAPFASHCIYTREGVLNDDVPEEREKGIRAGLLWGECADASVVYMDKGISAGMRAGMEAARNAGRVVEYRFLDGGGERRGDSQWEYQQLAPRRSDAGEK